LVIDGLAIHKSCHAVSIAAFFLALF